MAPLVETPVVTCFLRSEGEVLLLRRSDEVRSYAGRWGAVAGHVEGDADGSARREIEEETGFDGTRLVRRGDPFPVVDETLGRRWIVHPYLFDVSRREPRLNYESVEAEWTSPTEILRRMTVPQLWDSYRAVAPSVESIRRDRDHGSAYLSLRALEVLRDLAGEMRRDRDAADRAEATSREERPPDRSAIRLAKQQTSHSRLREVARAVIAAQPSMAAVRNRVNRAMQRARDAGELDRMIHAVLREAVASDRAAAQEAACRLENKTVLTLSRSGTVLDALRAARPRVLVATSYPGGEGASVASELAGAGIDVTLLPDAALAAAPMFDLVLLGCDTVLPDGSMINKVGSHVAALIARSRSVPAYVATSLDKLLPHGRPDAMQVDRRAVADVPESVRVYTELFETVPAELIDAYLTEHGAVDPGEMAERAAPLRELDDW